MEHITVAKSVDDPSKTIPLKVRERSEGARATGRVVSYVESSITLLLPLPPSHIPPSYITNNPLPLRASLPSPSSLPQVHLTFPHLSCNDLTMDYESTKSDLPSARTGGLQKRKMNSREKKTVTKAGFKIDEERSGAVGGQRGCSIEGVVNVGRVGGNVKVVLTSNVWGTMALKGFGEVRGRERGEGEQGKRIMGKCCAIV